MFHCIHTLCSNTLTLESIFECIRQKLKKKTYSHFKILSRDEVFTCLYFFFSSRDEISSAVFLTGMSSSCDEISKKHTHFKILSWDEVFTRLYFFFSSPDEISSAVF